MGSVISDPACQDCYEKCLRMGRLVRPVSSATSRYRKLLNYEIWSFLELLQMYGLFATALPRTKMYAIFSETISSMFSRIAYLLRPWARRWEIRVLQSYFVFLDSCIVLWPMTHNGLPPCAKCQCKVSMCQNFLQKKKIQLEMAMQERSLMAVNARHKAGFFKLNQLACWKLSLHTKSV